MMMYKLLALAAATITITINTINTVSAVDKCYFGGGLGSIGQSIYGPEFTEENTVLNPRVKITTKRGVGLQILAGCNIYGNVDVEIGAIINKPSSIFNPALGKKVKVSQKSFTIDSIFKAPSFDNGMQFYGKLGGGFFVNELDISQDITIDDKFGAHAALGVSYEINDETKIRAEYHYLPKGLTYEAIPIMVNLTYLFD